MIKEVDSVLYFNILKLYAFPIILFDNTMLCISDNKN